jgi:imidazoleglycerol-phosphate dehydratase
MRLMTREAEIHRKTKETDIRFRIDLDGQGQCRSQTEIPFLDHMFNLVAAHGFFNLEINAKGDIQVDNHHTVEDVGICMGKALKEALGERRGISRYGEATVPMDEALARVVLDISNRPFLSYHVEMPGSMVGTFDIRLLKEFFRALTNHGGVTMHIDLLSGENPHHVAEVIFKAFARALDHATNLESRLSGVVPSTKGIL